MIGRLSNEDLERITKSVMPQPDLGRSVWVDHRDAVMDAEDFNTLITELKQTREELRIESMYKTAMYRKVQEVKEHLKSAEEALKFYAHKPKFSIAGQDIAITGERARAHFDKYKEVK